VQIRAAVLARNGAAPKEELDSANCVSQPGTQQPRDPRHHMAPTLVGRVRHLGGLINAKFLKSYYGIVQGRND
jgi:hypothetical protein